MLTTHDSYGSLGHFSQKLALSKLADFNPNPTHPYQTSNNRDK